MELRTIQDWTVRREMLGTPGVADITVCGFVQQYEIAVNPERLRALNLTLTDIFEALEKTMKILEAHTSTKTDRLFYPWYWSGENLGRH